jgi:hypothetical protein
VNPKWQDNMKTYFFIAFLLLLTIGLGCKKDSLSNKLNGQWVRTDNRSDTITFGYKGNSDWFVLSRGFQVSTDGISRPIIPFGIYEYKIQGNNIIMHWSASNFSGWPSFSFSLSNSIVQIGNFIENNNSTLLFEKIK